MDGFGKPESVAGFDNPHDNYTATTTGCATCHRSHSGQNKNVVKSPAPQSNLCFTCHDGTGAVADVASQYSDLAVPANDSSTSSFYSHPATTASNHTLAIDSSEFAGVLNRHSECGDCHNPHQANLTATAETTSGWTASGALAGITGVDTTLTWKDPFTYEYELCFKCHSSYTQLLPGKLDKAAEFDPANNSYHPVEGAGKNSTTAMANSLAGGKLWQLTSSSTIRCVQCHGNYRLVSDPPTSNNPATAASLAPHTSQYRGLLIANYRDRDLKPQNEAYSSNDFALCFLCHDETPFSSFSWTATNFPWHRLHLAGIASTGSGGLDIDTLGAGQGNAICAECHYRIHGTKLAPWSGNQNYARGVNFAPNVQPRSGQTYPIWSGPTNKGCSLVCHGKDHDNKTY